MRFYGQENLVKELWYVAKEVKAGKNQNILFIAQSGYGKTALALVFADWCFPKLSGVQYEVVNKTFSTENLFPGKGLYILDEVHSLDSFEWLYPLLDRKESSFVFCTNEYGDLPEPLIRRCFKYFFEPYSDDDYFNIANESFVDKGINLSEDLVKMILQSCKKTPGYIKTTVDRLSIIFKNSFMPSDEEELNEIFVNVLGIKNGLDLLDRRYIDTLKSLGGISGLERIVLYSRIPRKVIEREIEPFLLEKKLIEITTKGRKLND